MIKYPWYSVDSSAWLKRGAYGLIWVPKKINGSFNFIEEPHNIITAYDSPPHRQGTAHYNYLSKSEKAIVHEWLDLIEIPFGINNKDKTIKIPGVMNHHACRKACNLFFFEGLRKALPKWPWPFPPIKKGFFNEETKTQKKRQSKS
jgi:hypothetical protein